MTRWDSGLGTWRKMTSETEAETEWESDQVTCSSTTSPPYPDSAETNWTRIRTCIKPMRATRIELLPY